MERTTKLNSVGESMENCRSAFSLVCEAIEVKNDIAGRPTLVTKEEPEVVNMTGEADETNSAPEATASEENAGAETADNSEETVALTPDAEKIIARDRERLGSFMGNIDQDTQFVNKNGMFVASDYTGGGLLGQANLIALVKKLADAGFKVGDDFGILSVGGAFGKYYYIWYNKDNSNVVNLIADVEKSIEDYPVVDETLYSNMESALADDYWTNVMDKDEKIQYYKDHGAEVDPVWEAEDFDGEIEKPDFFDDNGDITDKITGSIMTDQALKDSGLDIPEAYFV